MKAAATFFGVFIGGVTIALLFIAIFGRADSKIPHPVECEKLPTGIIKCGIPTIGISRPKSP